jgi:hypothetical protein
MRKSLSECETWVRAERPKLFVPKGETMENRVIE